MVPFIVDVFALISLAFRSLRMLSMAGRPLRLLVDFAAGSREGGFSPLGRAFSS